MDRAAYDSLTPRQKEALRLVGEGHRTKSIARLIGFSPHTINKDIEAATRALGRPDRFEAAHMARLLRGAAVYEPFVYEPERVEAGVGISPDGGGPTSCPEPSVVREERAVFDPFPSISEEPDPTAPAKARPPARGTLPSLVQIGVITLLILSAFVLVPAATDGFQRLTDLIAPFFHP